MFKQLSVLLPLCILGMVSCQSKPSSTDKNANDTGATAANCCHTDAVAKLATGPVDNAAVLARKQVPILCYHQIRDWKSTDSKGAKDYIVQIAAFKEHIKMLADSGYHTILPNQLYNYLNYGRCIA
jgi:hypothetical protein